MKTPIFLSSKSDGCLSFLWMKKSTFQTGEFLFNQGGADSGFFMLESGSMTASINLAGGQTLRVKKFFPGSVIGEMSNYIAVKVRTASVVANELSILYHLDPSKLDDLPGIKTESLAAIHELIARTLSTRIAFMNRRLMLELG